MNETQLFDFITPEIEEFFAVARSAVKCTLEHSDGHSYSYFVPKFVADHKEKNLRETNSPTTLSAYVIEQYSNDSFK